MKFNLSAVLSELGVILQFNGVLLAVPAIVALIFGELAQLLAILATATMLLSIGFLLNFKYKPGRLEFVSASILLFLTFLLVGTVCSLPYITFFIERGIDLTNATVSGIYESMAGVTTSGLTLIKELELLPTSLVFYRSFQQWVGGINIVVLFITLVSVSEETLRVIRSTLGLSRIMPSTRSTFRRVLGLYLLLSSIFTLALLASGIDLYYAVNLVFAGISTGGFMPVSDLSTILNGFSYVLLCIMMILGATNFSALHELITKKRFVNLEARFFLGWLAFIIAIALAVSYVYNINFSVSVFHIVSAVTTTGFAYTDLTLLPEALFMLIILSMFIGGCYSSTAGGFKIIRLFATFKLISWQAKRVTSPARQVIPIRLSATSISLEESIHILLLYLLTLLTVFISAFIIVAISGNSFAHSVFESLSALHTVGLSTGIIGLDTSNAVKLLLVFLMLIGRIEIIPLLILFKLISAAKIWRKFRYHTRISLK